MKGFERYDLARWIENGLSVHPPEATGTPEGLRRTTGRFLAHVTVPLMALGIAGIGGSVGAVSKFSLSLGNTAQQFPAQLLAATHSGIVPVGVGNPQGLVPSAVDAFEAHTAALLTEVLAGTVRNVSAHTLRLATAMVERHATTDPSGQPDWVEKVASEVAKLTD